MVTFLFYDAEQDKLKSSRACVAISSCARYS